MFCNKKPWMKSEGNVFDANMGAYDVAEICEFIGIFMLSKNSEKYIKNDIGLCRDNGLAVFKNIRIGTYKKELSIII